MSYCAVQKELEHWIDTHFDEKFYECYNTPTDDEIYEYMRKSFDNYDSGCCRFVLYPEVVNWVIKFNISKYPRMDYSENEYQNYLAAVEEGLEKFFVPTIFVCERNGVRFYAQECVECDEEGVSDVYYESCADEYFSAHEPDEDEDNYDIYELVDDMDTTDRLIALYSGWKELDNLIGFCSKREICDLHAANIGMLNGMYVLMDYASYQGKDTK